MYDQYLEILAKSATDVFVNMSKTEVVSTKVKKDERVTGSFALAQVIEYQHLDGVIKGHMVLGLSDESMAMLVASAVAQQMGLPPVKEFDETAADILGELLNTVVGLTISEWGRLGMPVSFGSPVWLKDSNIKTDDGLQSEAYLIILNLPINHIVFRVTFNESNRTPVAGKRVLVVDDSMVMRGLLTQSLTHVGCEVQEAKDGREATELYRSFQPHLTIMDLVMPDMSGLDAIIEIRQVDPKAKFIILTSTSRQDEVVTAKTLGVVTYLIKPVKIDAFLKAVRQTIGED